MSITDLMTTAVNYSRQQEEIHHVMYRPDERSKRSFIKLDVDLSQLADLIGWFHLQTQQNIETDRLLTKYNVVLKDFLVLGNLNHFNQQIAFSEQELQNISQKKVDQDLNKVYLIIKKMLFNSYFQRNENDFVYALKTFFKLGLVDLKLTWSDIQNNFITHFKIQG